MKNFPACKYGRLTNACAIFFFICSGSNICSHLANFPAKRLGKKYGAQNTHAPTFFFLKFKFVNKLIYLSSSITLSSIGKNSACVISLLFSNIYSVNHNSFIFNKVFYYFFLLFCNHKLIKLIKKMSCLF